jgi:O-antigen/teichoic acid export membrane protein
MAILIFVGLGPFGAVIGFTSSYIIIGIISTFLLFKNFYKPLKTQKTTKNEVITTIKTMVTYGLPLSAETILGALIIEIYAFLIAIYSTDLLVGNYQVAVNFSVLVSFFVLPIRTILFPAFSKVNAEKEQEITKTVFQSSVKFASLIIVPVTFAIMTLSKPGVSILFGDQYQFTPLYLSLHVMVFLLTSLGSLSTYNLIKSQGKTKINLKLAILSFVIGIILSSILISTFGILGLIFTHITARLPSLIISLWWIKKHYNATIDYLSSIKILVASAFAALPSYLAATQLNLPNWIILILGATIYLTTYIITAPLIGAINKTDTKNLKEMLKTLGPLTKIISIPLNIIEKLAKT